MENVEDILPLTPTQEGILYHCLQQTDTPIYFQQVALSLEGDVSEARLKASAEALISRHSILRAVILWEELERPVQVIRTSMPLVWSSLECQTDDLAEHTLEYLRRDRDSGFDLTQGPLIRFALIRCGASHSRLVLSLHHLLVDGWSTRLLIGDLAKFYGESISAVLLTPPGAPSFGSYLRWLDTRDSGASRDFWAGQLAGLAMASSFTTPPPDPSPGSLETHSQTQVTLPRSESLKIQNSARRLRVTGNIMAQAAWSMVLSRYADSNDVLFGTTLAGRPPDLADAGEIVGLFIETIPTRARIVGTQRVADWLETLQKAQQTAAEFGHSGLAEIRASSEIPGDRDLFDTLLVFESLPPAPAESSEFGNLQLLNIEFFERSHYPLAILVIPGDAWELIAISDTSRFGEVMVERVLASFVAALESLACANDQTVVSDLVDQSPEEAQQLHMMGCGPENKPVGPTWIGQFFEAAKKAPRSIALSQGSAQVSYSDLLKAVGGRALSFVTQGLQKGDFVGVLADRSPDTVISILAIMRAGAVYVPLEPTSPKERLLRILKDASLRWMIGDFEIEGFDISRLHLRPTDSDYGQSYPLPEINGDDTAYIIYTSGSTGKPRGVVVTHSNLHASTHARTLYYDDPVSRFLLLSSFAFDSSIAGIFWTLSHSGTLLMPERDRHADLEHLLNLAADSAASHLLCVPSLYQLLLEQSQGRLEKLSVAIVAGEVCSVEVVEEQLRQGIPAKLFNEYGPTEATVWSSVECVDLAAQRTSVSIGRPVPGVQLRILDESGRRTPIGVAGQLCVSGSLVARGYLNPSAGEESGFVQDAESETDDQMYLTGDRVRWSEEGKLDYLGREDSQVNIRGLRVEIGEVESALVAHDCVREAAVVMRDVAVSGTITMSELERALASMPDAEIEAALSGLSNDSFEESHSKIGEGFEFDLRLKEGYVSPPQDMQRRWMIQQLMREINYDIEQLALNASRFVSGGTLFLDETHDVTDMDLSEEEIMEDWQVPILQAMAQLVSESSGHVLEIGFGRGISASMIQKCGVSKHTIVEANEYCISRFFTPWRERHPDSDICMVHDTWQSACERLGSFDGIFFHTAARNAQEMTESTLGQVTYAEHFFPTASKHLNPGGIFTYLVGEIDSLGREHQRLLLRHFSSYRVQRVDQLEIPQGTKDFWWADSMIVVAAIK